MRIKIKVVDGAWRVILPLGVENWHDVARIRYDRYEDAWTAAQRWARVLGRELEPKAQEKESCH